MLLLFDDILLLDGLLWTELNIVHCTNIRVYLLLNGKAHLHDEFYWPLSGVCLIADIMLPFGKRDVI